MPSFNQTGPTGQGPMTGRKMGRCANLDATINNQTTESNENTIVNQAENLAARGLGGGRGKGRCRGGQGFGKGGQNGFRGGF